MKQDYEPIFSGNNRIVTGDFNAYAPLWTSLKVDRRGQDLQDLIEDKNFVILNIGAPTYQRLTGSMSV